MLRRKGSSLLEVPGAFLEPSAEIATTGTVLGHAAATATHL